jgi:hypothetical protein
MPPDYWETLHERFDPLQPAGIPAWRANRPLSPFDEITRALDLPFRSSVPRVLLTGTVGTGKTTELLRVAESRASREFVVFLDLEQHFTQVERDAAALHDVKPWEVCFLAGLAILRSAEDRLSFKLPESHLRDLEQAWIALARSSGTVTQDRPAIDVGKLAKAMVLVASSALPGAAAGLTALAALAETPKWSLPLDRKEKKVLPDREPHVQTLLQCVNVIIGLVQQKASKVLLILDGLDRIGSVERASELFIDSQMIGQLDCRVVLCGPFVLRRRGLINNVRPFTSVRPVVNVPVLSQKDPALPGDGIAFFRELYERRVADLGVGRLVAPELLDRLAYYSGGRGRAFVRFIRNVAEDAWSAGAATATAAIVEGVIDRQRLAQEVGLDRGHIRVLESLMADPDHHLPEDDRVGDLLANGSLLPYPDGSEWYYPHPLLTINFLRRRQAGSSG